MTKKRDNPIAVSLDKVLRPRDFVRRKKYWHLALPETILVVEMQKSEFSNKYYVNLAVSLRQLSEDPTPREHKCHFRHRLESLVKEVEYAKRRNETSSAVLGPLQIFKALDLEDMSTSESERAETIENAMIQHGLPFLFQFESIEKIRAKLLEKEKRDYAVSGAVWKIAGVRLEA